MAPVKIGDKHSYINKQGKTVLNLFIEDLEYAFPFNEGLAVARIVGTYGYIDKRGWVVIPAGYDRASSFSEGLAVVGSGLNIHHMNYWFIDKTGTSTINGAFSGVSTGGGFDGVGFGFDFQGGYMSEGLAAVSIKGKWGYIDKTGA
ncbi:WG repeat-containing protein, partial [bacterium]|nr:WG repeat-containing protein [bacterium]